MKTKSNHYVIPAFTLSAIEGGAGIYLILPLLLFFVFCFSFPIFAAVAPGCNCNDPNKCYSDECTRKTLQGNQLQWEAICKHDFCGGRESGACYNFGDPVVEEYFCITQPPCCAEMVRRNDPEACCWPERGYCHPFFCAKVSRPEQCGWYWTYRAGMSDRPDGYGCMQGSNSTLHPRWGLPAGVPGGNSTTVIPTVVPTTIPTIIPTRIVSSSSPRATSVPVVTHTPIENNQQNNLNSNFRQPTTLPIKSQAPIFTFPKIDLSPIKTSLKNTIVKSEKVFNVFSYIFESIISLDKKLENTVNGFFK